MIERTIVIDGLSKSHAMTGWRVGYTAGPEPVAAAMTKMQENIISCVTTVCSFRSHNRKPRRQTQHDKGV